MSIRKLSYLVTIFIVLVSIPVASISAQSHTYQVKVERILNNRFPEVDLYCSVLDVQGFPILGLTKEDFSLSEESQAVPVVSVEPYQNTDQKLAIVIALDTSGSMRRELKPSPLDNSVAAAKSFINQLTPDDQVALITFADEVNVVNDLSTNKDQVIASMDGLDARGATALNDAVMKSIDLLKNRSERRAIILLTDGRPEGTQLFTSDQALQEASQWAIPIYPIGFGNVDEKYLDRLAEVTGGATQIKPDSTTLTEAFDRVLGVFREEYKVSYHSTYKPDLAEHDLQVGVNYLGEQQYASGSFIARDPLILTMTNLQAGQIVAGQYTIKGAVDALNPPVELVFRVDGDTIGTPLTAAPYEVVWDTSQLNAGEYTISIRGMDDQNIEASVEVPVVVELQKPSWLIWVIITVIAISLAIILPISLRNRRKTVSISENVAEPEKPAGGPQLVEVDGLNPGHVWPLENDFVRLGRRLAENDIGLKGLSASRSHAVIEQRDSGWVVYSVSSNNPVIVNGKPVREVTLGDGDEIRLGESLFRFKK